MWLLHIILMHMCFWLRNYVRQKNSSAFFLNSSSKQVVKQRRQLTTSTMHLAQELLKMHNAVLVGSGSFAKETRALRMRIVVASHWKLAMTN